MDFCPPRLRSDLIIRPQQTAYEMSVIVKDPLSGKFFHLGGAELFIAEQLDGKTTLEVIRQRVEVRFGGELPIETLQDFLLNLKKYGFLETGHATRTSARKEAPRFRGSPLYCRFKVFDPCQLLNRMVSWTGFFYTPYFGVLSAATIVTAAAVTIGHWGEFRQELPRLYDSWSSIAVILALNFLVVGAHEFGHGLTCTRFGGEVHEMGCALVFLQPAFYCNVSDAWLFPEKSKRLWVGFAGPYFELFLWSMAVLTWHVSEPDTWINFVGLSVMATSGLKTLLNFNPLIKLDGYYLLSDYLELPNMRRRSFRYVGAMVEKLFGFEHREGYEVLATRERVIFSIYGTVALAGSFSILGYILLSAGGTLTDGRSPTAVLVTLGLLGMKYRRRFRRMFGKSSGASGSFDDEDFDEPEQADNSDASAALNETEPFDSSLGAPASVNRLVEGSVQPNNNPSKMPSEADPSQPLNVPRFGDELDARMPVKVRHLVQAALPGTFNLFNGPNEHFGLPDPSVPACGDAFEAGASVKVRHLVEAAVQQNDNPFQRSDRFLTEMYDSRIQRMLGRTAAAPDFPANREASESSSTVAVLEAPEPPNEIANPEAVRSEDTPQTAASNNGHVVTDPIKTVSAPESAPPQIVEDSEMPETPETLETTVVPKDAAPSGSAVTATSEADKPAEPKRKKSRRIGRQIRRAAWATVVAAAIFALVYGHSELRVAGPFNVLPVENSDVRAAVDGVLDKIYVQEGDYVREGQPIARLTDIDTRAALEKTEAQLAETGAKLRMQVAGPTANEIEVAKANVTKAEDNLKYAQIRLAMAKRVFDENLLSRKEYEDVAALESAARNDLTVAKDQLTVLVSGTRPEDIEATKAQIAQLKADQRHLGQQRRMLMVYSPSNGIVATPTLQLKQLKHQLVKKGDLVAKVFDLRTVTAQIAIDEKDIADVQVNQKVVLRARAYPDEVFYGTVNFVSTSVLSALPAIGGEAALLPAAPSSSSSTAKKTILITTQIDNQSLLLKPEMTGQAKILCGRRRTLDLFTRRFAHTVKVEFWSWW